MNQHKSRNDEIIRLIRAGDSERNIRRRYPVSDGIWNARRAAA